MRFPAALAVYAVLFAAAGSFASAERGEFVTSVSIGFAPVTRFSLGNVSESGGALACGFSEGYRWSDRDQLAVQWQVSVRRSDYFTSLCEDWTHLDGTPLGELKIWQFFLGLGWRHDLGERVRAPYAHVAIGMMSFSVDDLGQNRRGIGWELGGGYRFSERVQAGVFGLFGKTDDQGLGYCHTQVGCLVSFLRD